MFTVLIKLKSIYQTTTSLARVRYSSDSLAHILFLIECMQPMAEKMYYKIPSPDGILVQCTLEYLHQIAADTALYNTIKDYDYISLVKALNAFKHEKEK